MGGLDRHIHTLDAEEHARLPFRRDCPRCRVRLAGTAPSRDVVPARAKGAFVTAAVLASGALPATAAGDPGVGAALEVQLGDAPGPPVSPPGEGGGDDTSPDGGDAPPPLTDMVSPPPSADQGGDGAQDGGSESGDTSDSGAIQPPPASSSGAGDSGGDSAGGGGGDAGGSGGPSGSGSSGPSNASGGDSAGGGGDEAGGSSGSGDADAPRASDPPTAGLAITAPPASRSNDGDDPRAEGDRSGDRNGSSRQADKATREGPDDSKGESPTGSKPRAGAYTVERGDSLWSIARGLLGDDASDAAVAAKVSELWERNDNEVIRTGDPDLIHPGQELRL